MVPEKRRERFGMLRKAAILVFMKKNILTVSFICAFFLLFASCQKSSSSSSGGATFKFTANDSTYVWDGDMVTGHGSSIQHSCNTTLDSTCTFGISAEKDMNLIVLTVTKPWGATFPPGTYHGKYNDGFYLSISFGNGTVEMRPTSNDSLSLTIESVHDNMADGTFYGNIGDPPNLLQVTNGEFHNVKIYHSQ
jgi:hypothetical protein